MTTDTAPLDLDELLEEHAEAHLEYSLSGDGSQFEADCKKRREEAAASIRGQFADLKAKGSPGVMHEVDRAFYDLTLKERDAARVEADMWMRQVEALTNAARAYQKRTEHELEQITGVAKALRVTVAEMLSGKQHTRARTLTWESTLKYATEALANPAATAKPAQS